MSERDTSVTKPNSPRSSQPEYHVWLSMRSRCSRKTDHAYHNYGGRGILVCQRWNESFDNFIADMGYRPAGGTIERVNNDLGYFPENCRWASRVEQCRNRRGLRLISYRGETKCAKEWAGIIGINEATIRWRLRQGWPTHRVLAPAMPQDERQARARAAIASLSLSE